MAQKYSRMQSNRHSPLLTSDLQLGCILPQAQLQHLSDRYGIGLYCNIGVNLTAANINTRDLQDMVHRLIHRQNAECSSNFRAGSVNDGGWTVCTAGPYNLSSSSSVISGGIAKDWSFDTDITKKYGCRLDAFDPTIDYINDTTWKTDKILFHKIGLSAKTHITEEGWRLMSLGDIIDTFVGPGATVDYLKFDIEDYEVELIEQAVADGSLQRAKQVAFEIHVRSAFLIDPARLKR